jgi:uncharacterized caspase-like protein
MRLAALTGCILAGLLGGPALAERKVALVIGNGSYAHIGRLPNVPNDTAAMAALFKGAKFDAVEVRENLGVARLRKALREFSALAAGADMAVVYFAGHGIEVDRTNYLIPVDARLAADIDVEDETVSLDRVLQLMEPAKRLRLVILDACRENPFAGSMKRTVATRAIGRGLARIEPATSNTLIAFATKANAVADDGTGRNSPFTTALVRHLATPGLDVILALRRVRDDVLASTGNKQEPYFAGTLGGSTLALVAGAVRPGGQPQASAATLEWARVDKSNTAELETFARRHQTSVEAEYARARLKELRQLAVPSSPSTSKSAPPLPSRFTCGPSSFEKIGAERWINRTPTFNFHFKQDGVSGGYLYMFDSSRLKDNKDPTRPMYVRIPIAGGPTQWSFPNPFQWSEFAVCWPNP